MQKINLISQANPNMWQSFYNEFKELFKVEFVFSTIPVHADFHVIVEDHSKLKVANSRERIARIITEPPEIVKYSQKYLSQFGSIISPEFPLPETPSKLQIRSRVVAEASRFGF